MSLTPPEFKVLNDALVDAYDIRSLEQMLLFRLGKRLDLYTGERNLRNAVFDVTIAARQEGWLGDLISQAASYVPGNGMLAGVAAGLGLGPDLGSPASLERVLSRAPQWQDIQTFLIGARSAMRRVGRIERDDAAVGTGFLVGPGLVLTNHHVVRDLVEGRSATGWAIRFDYWARDRLVTNSGVYYAVTAVSAYSPPDDEPFTTDRPASADCLDFALLSLAGDPTEEAPEKSGDRRGSFAMPRLPEPLTSPQPLLLLQHPLATPLKIALGAATGPNATATRVRYQVDTERGSSGSPVLDPAFGLRALHHGSGPASMPGVNEGIPICLIAQAIDRARPGLLPPTPAA